MGVVYVRQWLHSMTLKVFLAYKRTQALLKELEQFLPHQFHLVLVESGTEETHDFHN